MPTELIAYAVILLGVGVGGILLLLAVWALEWVISK